MEKGIRSGQTESWWPRCRLWNENRQSMPNVFRPFTITFRDQSDWSIDAVDKHWHDICYQMCNTCIRTSEYAKFAGHPANFENVRRRGLISPDKMSGESRSRTTKCPRKSSKCRAKSLIFEDNFIVKCPVRSENVRRTPSPSLEMSSETQMIFAYSGYLVREIQVLARFFVHWTWRFKNQITFLSSEFGLGHLNVTVEYGSHLEILRLECLYGVTFHWNRGLWLANSVPS